MRPGAVCIAFSLLSSIGCSSSSAGSSSDDLPTANLVWRTDISGEGVTCPRLQVTDAGVTISLTGATWLDLNGPEVLVGYRSVLAQYDTSGNYRWHKVLASTSTYHRATPQAIIAMMDLSQVLELDGQTLQPTDERDLAKVTFSQEGVLQEALILSGPEPNIDLLAFAAAPDGSTFTATSQYQVSTNTRVYALDRWNPDGTSTWQLPLSDSVRSLGMDTDGSVILALPYFGQAFVGNHSVDGSGWILTKVDAVGNEVWWQETTPVSSGYPNVHVEHSGAIFVGLNLGNATETWIWGTGGDLQKKLPFGLAAELSNGEAIGANADELQWLAPDGHPTASAKLPSEPCSLATDTYGSVYVAGAGNGTAFVAKLTK